MNINGNTAPPAIAGTETRLNLFATGFNAHGQILDNGGVDIFEFSPLRADAKSVRVLFTGWSSTTLLVGDQLVTIGNRNLHRAFDPPAAQSLRNGFGDHNGLDGCLDNEGKLYRISLENDELCVQGSEGSPLIGHLALAGNGKVAISFKQAPNGRLCHILQFESLDEFAEWFRDPNGVTLEPEKQHFMMQGRPTQLLANTGTFMVLMEGGEVYTWGDPRYHSLRRSIAGEAETDVVVPAERPGVLDALGGLRIKKMACGGWMSAALSKDGALYIWGTGSPGMNKTIAPLREAAGGEVVLVDISEAGDQLDITDVGVGNDHIAVVAENTYLYVIGDNSNGQLGVGSDTPFVDEWTKLPRDRDFRAVICGPKSTFVFTNKD